MLTKTRKLLKQTTYVSIFFLCLHIAGFVSSIDAVMGARTSQGAIAWVISLNTFPTISLPAYWVLGRSKFKGYVTARQEDESELSYIARQVREHKAVFQTGIVDKYPAAKVGEQLADLPFVTGNNTELLINGSETFDSIFDGIKKAQNYILVQFFIVKDDTLGNQLKNLLIEKAQAGVKVYFLYDEIGCYKTPKSFFEQMQSGGVNVQNFHSRKGPKNRFQINFRNHRKIVLVDGVTCWIGGHNVGDEYLGNGPKFEHWRDTHLKIKGPASLAAQLSFLEDYHWATDQIIELDWTSALTEKGNQDILFIPSGPADRFETTGLMFAHAINSAKKRIWIASPYFVPDEAIITALQLAGLRGVDVRILIPDEPDHRLVYLAAFSYFQQAAKTGVKFYRYTKGFMHQKAMLVDDDIATIGTANFDNRSFRLNFELTAMVADNQFNKQVEQMFSEDFSHSRLMTEGEYIGQPYWFRLLVQLARLTAPML